MNVGDTGIEPVRSISDAALRYSQGSLTLSFYRVKVVLEKVPDFDFFYFFILI